MKAKVRSFTNGDWYTVVVAGEKLTGKASCSCPAWIFNRERRDCKHIRAARKSFGNFPKGTVKFLN